MRLLRWILWVGTLAVAGAASGQTNADAFAHAYLFVAGGAPVQRGPDFLFERVNGRAVRVTNLHGDELTVVGRRLHAGAGALMRRDVEARLADDPHLQGDLLSVSASPLGAVTVSGRVRTLEEAARVAWDVAGLHTVEQVTVDVGVE